jgi:cytochrome c-type biogenesis protein CcmH/NrfG
MTALVGLGDALTFSRQYSDAISTYRTALGIETHSLQARLGLGRALILSDQDQAGLVEVRRVLAREPRNVQALQLLAQVQGQPTADNAARARSHRHPAALAGVTNQR